ncbi:MAG TPA: malate dehydrogenase, partial [Desulfomonilia bacterium]|nr:malate dehydrogenase [Desulfomonilia bacterium]
MERSKILIIGAGMVGSSSAASIAARRLGTVFLYDTMNGLSLGRALDINHSLPSHLSDSVVVGCSSLDEAAGCDIVVITAGSARTAGMTRLDLLRHNAQVIGSLAPPLTSLCPDALVLLITNPVDVLTWYLKTLCPDMHVMGLGCSLDMIRLRYYIAQAASVSVESVAALVIGAHDDNMIPLLNYANIGGIPVRALLGHIDLANIIVNTRTAGSSIVNLMKTHSGYNAAGEVIAQIVESMVLDRGMVFPLSICPNGEFGYRNTCLALPCIVDGSGVRRIIEMELDEEEKAALDGCARSIAHQIDTLKDVPTIH